MYNVQSVLGVSQNGIYTELTGHPDDQVLLTNLMEYEAFLEAYRKGNVHLKVDPGRLSRVVGHPMYDSFFASGQGKPRLQNSLATFFSVLIIPAILAGVLAFFFWSWLAVVALVFCAVTLAGMSRWCQRHAIIQLALTNPKAYTFLLLEGLIQVRERRVSIGDTQAELDLEPETQHDEEKSSDNEMNEPEVAKGLRLAAKIMRQAGYECEPDVCEPGACEEHGAIHVEDFRALYGSGDLTEILEREAALLESKAARRERANAQPNPQQS